MIGGYHHIYSPLTIDKNHGINIDPSPRRYSASAILPESSYHLHVPSTGNILPSSSPQQQTLSHEAFKKLIDHQWRVPIFLCKCDKTRLASSLATLNDCKSRNYHLDAYIDCTRDDNESVTSTITNTTTTSSLKARKQGKSNRYK
jgi:hypothetical protein